MPSSYHSGKTTAKRKKEESSLSSRKKVKCQHLSLHDLPWKSLHRPGVAGFHGDDGILELEEVEDVEVVYEETEGGRVARFNVIHDIQDSTQPANDPRENESTKNPETSGSSSAVEEPVAPFDSEELLPNWHKYSLDPQLLRALHSKSFASPTPIQAASLPVALTGRDVVGIAQTGSGKTLAYGLPILHYLLSQPRPTVGKKRQVRALILAPTRELALQVSSHLNACLNSVESNEIEPKTAREGEDESKGKGKVRAKETKSHDTSASNLQKGPPHVSVAAIVGGMSTQKQRRILDRGVDVLVATPGRLWDIMEEDDTLSSEIKNSKFLVLDEADRMIEAGHFAELDNILRLTLRENEEDRIQDELDEQADDEEHEEDSNDIKDGLQTFVFSATLSKDLQRNVKRRSRPKSAGKRHKKQDQKAASTLDDLLLRLDFRDPDPAVIDLSPVGGVVSTLQESKIECLSADKDVYLYYFLLRYPGRSLVFLSSIDGIRRLLPLTELLNIKAFPLHSQLEQRQRLKNLDRFKATPNAVLLATDIAARGLDIPAVDHVIHYQIPRSADAYVHRNGRTARAMMKGFSMIMCAPDERRVVRALLGNLGRQDSDIPEMAIELSLLDKLKYRVHLARKIETSRHKIKKANHEKNWMRETAEAMEIELDSDFVSDDEDKPAAQIRKSRDAKSAGLKAELKHLLSQPLIASGISAKYITSGSRPIADDLIAGQSHKMMVGVRTAEATHDVIVGKPKHLKPSVEKVYEEWNGIQS